MTDMNDHTEYTIKSRDAVHQEYCSCDQVLLLGAP